MSIVSALIAAAVILLAAGAPAIAESNAPKTLEQMGTPEQRAACRADVRRFCRSLGPEDGEMAFYRCLRENGAKLQPKCAEVVGVRRDDR